MSDLPLIHRDPPIRWPDLITAMQEAGYSLRDIAGALALPHTTVRSWQVTAPGREGPSVPTYEDGKALLQLFNAVSSTLKGAVQIA